LNPRFFPALAALASVTVIGAVAATPAGARPKVLRPVATRASISAERAADGTITARVIYRSKDPRCLVAKRFKRVGMRNEYFQAYMPEAFFHEEGHEVIGQVARGPDVLHPVTPFGKTSLTFEAVIPGSTYISGVKAPPPGVDLAQATGVRLYVTAPVSAGQGLPYFKVARNEDGKRVITECEALKGATYDGFGGKYVIKTIVF
jgi:hypothetical protein